MTDTKSKTPEASAPGTAVATPAWASPDAVMAVLTSTDRNTFSDVIGYLSDDASGELNRGLIAAGITVADRSMSGARLAKAVGYSLLLRSGKVNAAQVATMAKTSEGDVSQLKLAGDVVTELGLPDTITAAELLTGVGKRSKAIREALTSKATPANRAKAIAREAKVACDAKRLARKQLDDKKAREAAAVAKKAEQDAGEAPEQDVPDVPSVTIPELREQHVTETCEAIRTLVSFLEAHGGLTGNDAKRISAEVQALGKHFPKTGGKLAGS